LHDAILKAGVGVVDVEIAERQCNASDMQHVKAHDSIEVVISVEIQLVEGIKVEK